VLGYRRTRSGDAWAHRNAAPSNAVSLGLPTIGAPPVEPAQSGACVLH
jgi:tRNA-2-methylthio-N6-dimethylallyladenosine synthase